MFLLAEQYIRFTRTPPGLLTQYDPNGWRLMWLLVPTLLVCRCR